MTDCLTFHPNPKVADYVPRAGAVDAYCHVFEPEVVPELCFDHLDEI